jgi:uncharacterized protein YjbJ (UPF0337 family)
LEDWLAKEAFPLWESVSPPSLWHGNEEGQLKRETESGKAKEENMNWDQVSGQWKQLKGKIKEQWGNLTDDEIDVAAGKRDQFVGKIQEKYGMKKEEAEKRVDQWLQSLDKK